MTVKRPYVPYSELPSSDTSSNIYDLPVQMNNQEFTTFQGTPGDVTFQQQFTVYRDSPDVTGNSGANAGLDAWAFQFIGLDLYLGQPIDPTQVESATIVVEMGETVLARWEYRSTGGLVNVVKNFTTFGYSGTGLPPSSDFRQKSFVQPNAIDPGFGKIWNVAVSVNVKAVPGEFGFISFSLGTACRPIAPCPSGVTNTNSVSQTDFAAVPTLPGELTITAGQDGPLNIDHQSTTFQTGNAGGTGVTNQTATSVVFDPSSQPLPTNAEADAWIFEVTSSGLFPTFTIDPTIHKAMEAYIYIGSARIERFFWRQGMAQPLVQRLPTTTLVAGGGFIGSNSYVLPNGSGEYTASIAATVERVDGVSSTVNWIAFVSARPLFPAPLGTTGLSGTISTLPSLPLPDLNEAVGTVSRAFHFREQTPAQVTAGATYDFVLPLIDPAGGNNTDNAFRIQSLGVKAREVTAVGGNLELFTDAARTQLFYKGDFVDASSTAVHYLFDNVGFSALPYAGDTQWETFQGAPIASATFEGNTANVAVLYGRINNTSAVDTEYGIQAVVAPLLDVPFTTETIV